MLILYGLRPLEMAHWAPPPFWVYVPPSLLLRTEATAERGSSPPQCSFSLGWVSPSQGTSRLDSFTASSLPPFFREGPTGCLERGPKRPPLLAFGQNLLGVLSFSACADILLSFPFPRVVAKGKTLSGGSSTRARAASHPTDHADFPTTLPLFSPFFTRSGKRGGFFKTEEAFKVMREVCVG